MIDSMTFQKISASLIGALLIFLLGKFFASEIYHAEVHGEASYVIEIEGAVEDEPEEIIDVAALLASADVDKGEGVFRKCSACHKLDGSDGVGPHLNGVVGREIAAIAGFGYSGALSAIGGAWTPEELYAFVENPKGYAPGTTMGFAGLKKPADKANLIAYLQTTAE
ncbi:MAG: cytochrome c family protein [Pseudomonadota bacterium]